ncbi:MAG: hypothetical protein AAF152_10285, partial [Cyanobacteria bacterium P01_A01_bin.114]
MQLIFSLVTGLIIAFALQLLSANLGIAVGLTLVNWSPRRRKSQASSSKSADSSFSLPITHLVGFGVAFSLSAVIFAAALLTTEFSEIMPPRRGAIFGIILWATYWLLFAWLSSTTISSVADSIWGTAVSGGRRLVSALRQTIRADEEPLPENQSTFQHLAAEVSQLAEQQQQLPQLLYNQTETLLTGISELKAFEPKISELNMAELTHQPASNSAPVPQELPAPDLPDLSGPSVASSSLLSQLPSWREML